tara:strand:- start:869 stop:1987 length:1119 start_codon:yes stop_codon:yes gene_type:complete
METERLTHEDLMRLINGAMPMAVASLAILAFLYTLHFAADLFLPVFFALFLSIILRPVVRALKCLRIPEGLGALVVIVAMAGFIVGAVVNLSGPAEEWLQRLPSIQREIEAKLWPVTRSIEQAKQATKKIQELADGAPDAAPKQEVSIKSPSLLERAFETTWFSLVQILITLALTYFFLARNAEQTKASLQRLLWREHQESVQQIFDATQSAITRYLRISAVIYSALGILTALSMYLLGMPNAILWGLLAAILGFMPYVGPLIVFGCISVVSLLTFDDWGHILAPPIVYGMLTIIEGYFVTTTVLGRRLTLSPIAIFLSMLLWTWIWGISGALLSVPVLVVLTVLIRHALVISRENSQPKAIAGTAAVSEAT